MIPVPEVTTRVLDEQDLMLFLATDGVWDVMDNEEGVSFMNGCARRQWQGDTPGEVGNGAVI